MFQTLPGGVSCFWGQTPFVLYLHVRWSGMCCRPDPPVRPTGSVFRISTTLPEGSSTSPTPVTPGEDGSLQSGLPSRPYRYSESSDLLCSDGNPHKDCCLILFSPSSSQDVGSRSVSCLSVPFLLVLYYCSVHPVTRLC